MLPSSTYIASSTHCVKTMLLFVGVCAMSMRASADTAADELVSVVNKVGPAEMRSLTPTSAYYPKQQPEIYWHDPDYRIDLQLPYRGEQHPYLITILPKVGQRKEVQVNANSDAFAFGEILSITRGPNDKATVAGIIQGVGVAGFSVIDLKTGKLIDTVDGYNVRVSPNSRYVFFETLFPPHSPNPIEIHYRLYDVLKTPMENICCGYKKSVDWRGQAIYPVKSDEICRPSESPDAKTEDMHWGVSDDFVWSSDSSAVAFADTQGAVMSIVLVTMPTTPGTGASTFIYTPPGQGERCADNCTEWKSVHLTWSGDTISATYKFKPYAGKYQVQSLSLKKTDFTAAPR